jgi:hypothetical protein
MSTMNYNHIDRFIFLRIKQLLVNRDPVAGLQGLLLYF